MKLRPWIVCAALAVCAAPALADTYTDGRLTVTWDRTGDDYAGTFALGARSFPATGHASGADVSGTFTADGTGFGFTGSVTADGLTLDSGGRHYALRRTDAAAAAAAVPAGYVVSATDDRGVAVRATKANVRSVQEGLSAAVVDADRLFDAKPTLTGAAEDQHDHRSGVAVVTGQRGGRPARGVVSCQLNAAGGADVLVVVANADAPAGVWQKLSAPHNGVAAAADHVALRQYELPDGTGTVGVPDGWTAKATSMLDPMEFDGPDGAKLIVNGSLIVNTPDCQLVQMYRQSAQWARQAGMPPPPTPQGLFAKFGPPSEAEEVLSPQLNRMSQQQGLPTYESHRFVSVQPTASQLPDGRAQLLEETAVEVAADGTRTPVRTVGRVESAMLGQDAWMLEVMAMTAHDDQFAKMQPVMLAILNGGHVNQEQCNRVSQQRNQQQQQQLAQTAANNQANLDAQFKAGQKAHDEQMASYDKYNHNWAVGENLKDRSNDNFIEHLRGTRDVVDTRTGDRSTVGLTDAPGIVDRLNQNDPGRYGQVPLRDDMHPLIGN